MIQIDMLKKQEVRVANKSFHLENNVIILPIELLNYDTTGKTITAVFEPAKIETGALEVVDNTIQIPIYSSMVKVGVNYIQLNFRWENKLEQGPKMIWVIDKSLETEGVAQEDIDIISYLVNEIKSAKETADRVISDVGDIKQSLDQSIEDADTTKTNLDGVIGEANTKKTELEDTVDAANTKINEIIHPETGTIKIANDSRIALEGKITEAGTAQTNLHNKIGEANTAKEEIEQAIVDNQIVKQSEFTEHKLDYVEQIAEDLQDTHIFRTIPNVAKDEVINGIFTKRVSDEVVLNGNLNWVSPVLLIDFYRFQIADWVIGKNVLQSTNGSGYGYCIDGGFPISNVNSAENRAINFGHIVSNNYLYIRIEKAKIDAQVGVDTLAKLKTYLNLYPITLTYQLATPVIVPLPNPISPNALQIVNLTEQVQGKANKVQEAWITPTLLNGWVHSATGGTIGIRYRKDSFGRVIFKGKALPGAINLTMFTLPVGYRPSSNIEIFPGGNASKYCWGYISITGDVVMWTIPTSWVSFENLSYSID